MNYDRLPKSEHKKVIEYVEQNKMKELLAIHDKYKLTKYHYGCCDLNGLMTHFKHGIEQGLIK